MCVCGVCVVCMCGVCVCGGERETCDACVYLPCEVFARSEVPATSDLADLKLEKRHHYNCTTKHYGIHTYSNEEKNNMKK